MAEQNPILNDVRQARRLQRLGPGAICIHCGATTPEALKLTRCRIVEAHHVMGEAYDPDVVAPHCLNCHAIESEGQRARGVDLRHDTRRTILDTLVVILGELGAFFSTLGASCTARAQQLVAFTTALDVAFPAWRSMPEAWA